MSRCFGQAGRPRTAHIKKVRQGSASALIILVLTVLILLGVLALVTVASDFRLAQRRASWQQIWFETDEQAVRWLALLDLEWQRLSGRYPDSSAAELNEAVRTDLEDWLDAQSIQEPSIQIDAAGITISGSVGLRVPPEPTDQMLDVVVRIDTNRDRATFGQIRILQWAQWQENPVIPEESGVIWVPQE